MLEDTTKSLSNFIYLKEKEKILINSREREMSKEVGYVRERY